MRVLCVNSNFTACPIKIIEGQIYEVLDTDERYGNEFYMLYEDGLRKHWFLSTHFIPLSDIDETQLAEQKEEFSYCV